MTDKTRQRGDYVDLQGNGRIVLFKRQNLKNPKWQVRISVPNAGGYRVQSTKTTDRAQAERFAYDLYEDLYIRVKQGGALTSPKAKHVIDEWIEDLRGFGRGSKGGQIDQTISTINNYLLKFVGESRIVDLPQQMGTYWSWRESNYMRRKPCAGTLRREVNALRTFFKFVLKKGYIQELPDLAVSNISTRTNRRPTFTLDEWRRIYRSGRNWVKKGQQSGHHDTRLVAFRYFLLLANSGMRVGEARELRWTDVQLIEEQGKSQVIANVSGKTGTRTVVFQPKSEVHFRSLWNVYQRRMLAFGDQTDEELQQGYVFQHRDGSKIQSFKKSFNSLLDFAEVPIQNGHGNRTIYSLRHFYATMRLSNNVSPFILAKQMGTSVQMLEKYYGQVVTSEVAGLITRTQPSKNRNIVKSLL